MDILLQLTMDIYTIIIQQSIAPHLEISGIGIRQAGAYWCSSASRGPSHKLLLNTLFKVPESFFILSVAVRRVGEGAVVGVKFRAE